MVSFFGNLQDLVSTATSVAKEISKEVVSDVRVAVKTATAPEVAGKETAALPVRSVKDSTVTREKENTKPNSNSAIHRSNNQPIRNSNNDTTHTAITDVPVPPIPSSLDLHYVTDHVLVMPQPTVDAWTAKCYFDKQKNKNAMEEEQDKIPFEPTVLPHRNDVVVLAEFLEQRHTARGQNNHHYTVFNVSDVPAEDTIVRALQGQIVHLPWASPSSPRSETPSLSAMLEIVYTLHAYLTLNHEQHTAIIYCDNGKTRSALVVACYLTYIRYCHKCRDGFVHFLRQTQTAAADAQPLSEQDALELWNACPPSLHTFARNFDQTVVEWAEYRNPKPLLLRAIALQGIPVEDKPCLDIWDGQQRHIYSSHPELWTDLVDTSGGYHDHDGHHHGPPVLPLASPPPTSSQQMIFRSPQLLEEAQSTPLPIPEGDDDNDNHLVSFAQPSPQHQQQQQQAMTPKQHHSPHHRVKQQPPQSPQSQWADEEGFYRVNVVLEGDFCLLCRFGGVHAGSDKDGTKVLFRYANTTVGMGAGGPYELPPTQVDLMRRYAHCFDPDDFLCTLLVEAHWNVPEVYWQERLNRPCQGLPPVLQWNDIASVQRGWHLYQQHSVLQPDEGDVQLLLQEQQQHASSLSLSLSKDMVKLSLQRANGNIEVARESLRAIQEGDPHNNSIMAKLWNILQPPLPATSPSLPLPISQSSYYDEEEDIFAEETQNILDVLDSVDFGDDDDDDDFLHIPNYDEFLPPRRSKKKAGDDSKKKLPKGGGSSNSKPSPYSPPQISRATHLQQQPQDEEPLYVASPFIHNMPRQGEIVHAFGEYYRDIHRESLADFQPYDATRPLIMGESLPQLPYVDVPSSDDEDDPLLYSAMDDPANAAAVELLLQMDHPGISLKDLTNLLEEAKYWNKPQPPPLLEEKKSGEDEEEEGVLWAMGKGGLGRKSSGTKSGPVGPAPPVKDHPKFSKYFKLLRSGKPLDDVKEMMKKDGKDPTIVDLDPEKSLSSQRPHMADQEVFTTPNAVENAQKALQEALLRKKGGPKENVVIPKGEEGKEEDPDDKLDPQAKLMAALSKNKASADDNKDEDRPLRTDPVYAKYFKMLKMGMSKEQIQHAMKRDEKDPTIIDLDPERSLVSQRPPPKRDDPPLKDDPEYQKYFKMLLKLGMPKEQVAHALQRDGKDPAILDLDPEKSLKSQRPSSGGDDGPPLKEDEEYKKYFKMLNMGMVKEQVVHALQRDGKDPKILDLDPEKSLKSQQKSADDGPPLKEDEAYKKYFKMLNMGMAKEQVVHALQRDGKDPKVLDLDPEKSLKSQQESADDGPPLKEDEAYKKYFKMLNMGMAKEQVVHALQRDGKDAKVLDLDPEKSLKSQQSTAVDPGPPLREDPEFVKYFKMLNMGLPKDAVKNALARDGKDPSIMDLDPGKSLKFQMGGEEEKDTGTPLKDDPEYVKYFKMLNMGLPKDAVKNALSRDGKDPAVMDLDPNKSVEFQMKKKSGGGGTRRTPNKKKKKVRRKKIYWTPINPEQIKEDSIWNLVKGSVNMDKLNYDVAEFESLFTESADPADRKKNKRKKTDSSKQKKSVQVIDGKRSMNGGIILARMKVEYTIIAKSVDEMQHKKFDATQMKALKEFLPTVDERQGLKMYMKNGEKDPKVKEQLYRDLSECEKYMYTMIDVPKAPEKFDCMLFRNQFKVRFEDLLDALKTVEAACEETRNSERLRRMMAMILTLVNQINTGGESSGAAGFSLDALLKLNEAKAFDKKTSVLMYLAKLVKKNDESLLGFQEDLATVRHAENIILDSLASDLKTIEADLEKVHSTAAEEAERLESAGELKPFSLQDLKELKTSVYTIENVPHFNKVDHHSGRTPMERFALNSQDALRQAGRKIDILKEKYQSLLLYFGEDDKMPSNEFFGVMRRFIEEFEKATDQVEKMEAARIKEEKRSAKRAEQERRKSSIKAGPGGGLPSKEAMASLAKIAADKKGGKGKAAEKKGKASGIGGIAAMAAMAASKKTDPKPSSVGGIAAMAALAAKKKPEGTTKPSGGIAAMAALAAKKKPEATSPGGGLAAMAAMSAKKKPGTSGASGLAAMAAMSAKKKDSPAKASTGGLAAMAAMSAKKKPAATSPGGGLAAMAAMSAKKKTDATVKPASGGLAAMAAMSAKKKPVAGSPGGGLAAMAAMSAQKKADSPAKPSSGGLAAMAAMSAKKKGDSPANPASGGLAAMAAMSAKKTPEATSPGGLAAMAAMSAKKKPDATSPGGLAAMAAMSAKKPEATSPGGLAAMAALSSKKKTASTTKPAPGGLAAMAAMSGKKKPEGVGSGGGLAALAASQKSGGPPKSAGGIAAMAAMSAQKKAESKPVASSGLAALAAKKKTDAAPATSGGLSAMAKLAASKKNETSQATSGGLAAMAAKSQPQRQKSGGLASLAARSQPVRQKSGGLPAVATKSQPVRQKSGGLPAVATRSQPVRQKSVPLRASATKTQPERQKSGTLPAVATRNQPVRQKSLPRVATRGQPVQQKSGVLPTRTQPVRQKSGPLPTKSQPVRQQSGTLPAVATRTQPARQKSLPRVATTRNQPQRQKSGTPATAGGIAAMAAQSRTKEPDNQKTLRAMKRLETSYNLAATTFVQEHQQGTQQQTQAKSGARPGGLAAMAASKASSGPKTGGLAAMAANSSATKSATPARGLASMAAASGSQGKASVSASSGGLASMAAAAKKQSVTAATRTTSASSDSHRGGKRKVYDKQSGLYNDKSTSSSAAAAPPTSFTAAPNATLFQLGSNSSHGRQSKDHGHGHHTRATPARTRTGGMSRATPRKGVKPANEKPAAARQTITRSRSSVEQAASFPPPVTFGGNGNNNKSSSGGSTGAQWLSSPGSFPPSTEAGFSIGQPPAPAPAAAFSSSTGSDDFMASLGFEPKEKESEDKGPSVNFTMRRQPREKKNSQNPFR